VALDIAHTYRDYTGEAYRATAQDVTLAVKKAYYGVLLCAKLVEANRQGLDVVRANCENIRSQYNHGTRRNMIFCGRKSSSRTRNRA